MNLIFWSLQRKHNRSIYCSEMCFIFISAGIFECFRMNTSASKFHFTEISNVLVFDATNIVILCYKTGEYNHFGHENQNTEPYTKILSSHDYVEIITLRFWTILALVDGTFFRATSISFDCHLYVDNAASAMTHKCHFDHIQIVHWRYSRQFATTERTSIVFLISFRFHFETYVCKVWRIKFAMISLFLCARSIVLYC